MIRNALADYGALEVYLNKKEGIPKRRKKITRANAQWLLDNVSVTLDIQRILTACLDKHHKYEAINDPIHQHSLHVKDRECEALVAAYAEKGIDVQCHVYEAKIQKIKIKCLTDAQWVDLFNKDGELLPACCGQISHIRDTMMTVARNDHWIGPWELCEMVDALKNHSHGVVLEVFKPLETLWEAVKGDCKIHQPGYTVDPNELQDAITILENGCRSLSFHDIFSQGGEDPVYCQKMDKVYQLAQVMPAVRTVYNYFLGQNLPEIDGWALCDGDEVYKNPMGLSVYRTAERAEYWKGIIVRAEKENRRRGVKLRLQGLAIRPVRVSVKDGIVFMEGRADHHPPDLQLEIHPEPRKRRKVKK